MCMVRGKIPVSVQETDKGVWPRDRYRCLVFGEIQVSGRGQIQVPGQRTDTVIWPGDQYRCLARGHIQVSGDVYRCLVREQIQVSGQGTDKCVWPVGMCKCSATKTGVRSGERSMRQASTEVLRVINHQEETFFMVIFFFFKVENLFLVVATVKTRPVLKRARHGLSYNWCTQWVKTWGHAEKVIFSSHDLKT